jgi:hypothetical protein
MAEIACVWCRRLFHVGTYEAKHGRKFCSHACQGLSSRKPLDVNDKSSRYHWRRRGLDVPKRSTGSPPRDFWSQVDKSGPCWLWTGTVNRDGYGTHYQGRRKHMAHRWAWVESGRELPNGSILMHRCDVPACVNPDHLRVGTHQDNQADKFTKGRQAKGSCVGNAILTEAAVEDIRRRYVRQSRPGAGGGNVRQLAAEYGVTLDTIYKVVSGKHWGHVA